jgi:hypothetical protein
MGRHDIQQNRPFQFYFLESASACPSRFPASFALLHSTHVISSGGAASQVWPRSGRQGGNWGASYVEQFYPYFYRKWLFRGKVVFLPYLLSLILVVGTQLIRAGRRVRCGRGVAGRAATEALARQKRHPTESRSSPLLCSRVNPAWPRSFLASFALLYSRHAIKTGRANGWTKPWSGEQHGD